MSWWWFGGRGWLDRGSLEKGRGADEKGRFGPSLGQLGQAWHVGWANSRTAGAPHEDRRQQGQMGFSVDLEHGAVEEKYNRYGGVLVELEVPDPVCNCRGGTVPNRQ